jgi:multiple sugar transport system permease protein
METPRALGLGLGLRVAIWAFLAAWTLLALFPLFWIGVMSLRVPVDALAANPLTVLFGPTTRARLGGLSPVDLALGIAALIVFAGAPKRWGRHVATYLAPSTAPALGMFAALLLYLAGGAVLFAIVLPAASSLIERVLAPLPLVGLLAEPLLGMTFEHYRAVWVQHGFHRNFVNSLIVTAGVVTVSLSVGTLAGYALARTGTAFAFALLIAALVFRALPHSVLVTGYIPIFVNSREIFAPLWDSPTVGWLMRGLAEQPPTLYGQPWAVIAALVAINQPFTIWMLRSFFQNIPAELDEAARVDGCSHLGAFLRVIMPVMWPGVITTGLFSFLLAYNDYLVTALLLDAQSQTMVPAITQFLNRDTRASDQIEAIAAAVSITAPLFLLVMVFQKQIVAGLTQGAVKG